MHTPIRLRHCVSATFILLVSASTSAGTPPKTFGSFKDWQAVSSIADKKRSCYIVSRPVESSPKNANRGDIYFMVIREAGAGHDKLSLRIGYPFKEGATATVRIGKQVFRLNTVDKYAWPADKATARRLVKAMRAGQDMKVSGVSTRGTKTTDKFSLLGFTAAHKAITKACK